MGNYPQRLEHYRDNMLLVTINNNKDAAVSSDGESKCHDCMIEKY